MATEAAIRAGDLRTLSRFCRYNALQKSVRTKDTEEFFKTIPSVGKTQNVVPFQETG